MMHEPDDDREPCVECGAQTYGDESLCPSCLDKPDPMPDEPNEQPALGPQE